MPLRVEGPPRTEMKPIPWNVSPGLVAPGWRWAWEDGLRAFFPMWEGGGSTLLTYQRGPDASITTPVWGATPAGVGIQVRGTVAQKAVLDSHLDPQPTEEITCLVYVTRRSAGAGGYMFSRWQGWGIRVDQNDTTGVRGYIHVQPEDANYNIATPGGTLPVDEPVAAAIRFTGDELTVWVDGVQRASTSAMNSGSTITEDTTNDPPTIGEYNGGADLPFPGDVMLAGIWDKAHPDARMRQITRDPFGPFRRQTIRYTGGPTAGVVTITEDITDTNTVNDTVDDTLTLVEALTSANVITDSVTEQFAAQVISESLSDQIVAADVLNENLVLVETLSDGFVVVDNLTDLLTLSETISDATVSADTVGLRITNTNALTDTVSVTDTVSETISGVITEALTDALVATDAVSESQIMTESPQDVLSAADQLDEVAILVEDLTGDVSILDTLTETVTSPGIIRETLTDNFAVSDTADLTATLTEQLSGDIRVLDTEADTAIFVIAVSDQATITDTASASGLIVFTVLDDRGVEIVDEKFNVEVLDSEFETESFDDDFEVE